MTVAEQKFMEKVPILLHLIASQLECINETLKRNQGKRHSGKRGIQMKTEYKYKGWDITVYDSIDDGGFQRSVFTDGTKSYTLFERNVLDLTKKFIDTL